MKKFEFLEHTADVKFKAYGKTLEEVYENSAAAMFNSLYEKRVKKKTKKKIEVEGKDYESLMYNFLEELLFLLDSEGFFLSSAKVKVKDNKLVAEAWGDKAKNYSVNGDIKAITYHEMFVKKVRGGWVAQVVLDV